MFMLDLYFILNIKLMKKVFFLASALSLLITQTACFGSFSLIKKFNEFNPSAVDNNILKILLFYGLNIVPVYSVTYL